MADCVQLTVGEYITLLLSSYATLQPFPIRVPPYPFPNFLMMFQRFNNLNLGDKINLGFAALVLVLLLIVGRIFFSGSTATQRIDLTVDVRVPTTLAATSAQANLLKMEAALRGYLAVGDLQNIDDYNQARERFQANLSELKTLSTDWTNQQDVERLTELISIFAAWLVNPDRIFTLHNNPLENQRALRLETVDVQPLNTALLAQIQRFAQNLQRQDSTSPLLAEIDNFQASFEGMSTNLSAYAATGDLLFKFRYSDELVTNSQHFGTLSEALTSTEQTIGEETITFFNEMEYTRATLLTLAGQIFAAVEGEQSHLDLYLFQREMEPKTEQMIELLEALALSQQSLLQAELNDGNRSLTGLRYETLLGGAMVLLLGAAMVYIFRRNIAAPIHRLSRTAEQIGAGELSARAVVETDDEIGQLAVTFNRMTGQLSETFQALAEARDRAEDANRAKSKFLASMSHELRTPLNAILGYVQILQRKDDLLKQQHDALEIIQNNGEHLLSFINDILDLSKIEASKLELQLAQLILADFLGELCQEYHKRATEHPTITFVADIDTPLPFAIMADEMRLRQILLNLLENAFKFTSQGEIKLTLVVLERTVDAVRLNFTVSDTGIGISSEELETIFRPFEQVGASDQRAKGSGLGLAIAQELVYAMNSALLVESTPEQGSSFFFETTFLADWRCVPSGVDIDGENEQALYETYQASRPASHEKQVKQMPLVHLSDQEIDELLDMAYKGELLNLQKRSTELARENPANQPFVDALQVLIKTYDDEKLVEMLELYSTRS